MNWRSIWAVGAGALVVVGVTTLVDVVLHVAGVFPPLNEPINDSLALLAIPQAWAGAKPYELTSGER